MDTGADCPPTNSCLQFQFQHLERHWNRHSHSRSVSLALFVYMCVWVYILCSLRGIYYVCDQMTKFIFAVYNIYIFFHFNGDKMNALWQHDFLSIFWYMWNILFFPLLHSSFFFFCFWGHCFYWIWWNKKKKNKNEMTSNLDGLNVQIWMTHCVRQNVLIFYTRNPLKTIKITHNTHTSSNSMKKFVDRKTHISDTFFSLCVSFAFHLMPNW